MPKYGALFLFLALSSCSIIHKTDSSYILNVPNVPMFEEAGQGQVSVYVGYTHYDIVAAYALDSHLLLGASYFNGAGQYYEATLGYYRKLGRRTWLEIIGGVGVADINYTNDFFQGANYYKTQHHLEINADNFKVFVQPSYHIRLTENAKIGGTFRLGIANFNNYRYFEQLTLLRDNSVTTTLQQGNLRRLFVEPVITVKSAYKRLNMVAQSGYSFMPTDVFDTNMNAHPVYQRFFINLGLQISIGK